MKLSIFLTAIAFVSAGAQPAPMAAANAPAAKPASTIGATETASVSLQTIRNLEKEMENRIVATGTKTAPCNVLSPARGLYITGLGAVFQADVELAPTPGGIGAFQTTVYPQQKAKYRNDKLANIPLLEKTLSDLAQALAASPALKMSDRDQVVVAARLVYRSWEDVAGMPGEIVAHLDRRDGTVKLEIQ